jgi:branched-chain amino acid transport system ATP-binding protein
VNGLQLRDVSVRRGPFPIIHDLTLDVPAGEVTVLLGPNGAGKTTLLEAISGILPIAHGTISTSDTEIQRLSRVRRARHGLAHVEQGRTVFTGLTVLENLMVADRGVGVEEAFELFPALRSRSDSSAGLLSGGEQQMLVLARALLSRPSVLVIDELSLGLAPIIVHGLLPVVRRLADTGVAVLLVEQYAPLALEIGDGVHVLNRGRVVASGTCTEMAEKPDVLRRAYLGERATDATTSGVQ